MTIPPRKLRVRPKPLLESKIQIMGGAIVTLHKNLEPLALTQLMSEARDQTVYGYIMGEDVVYWDAFSATHEEIAVAMHITFDPNNRVSIWRSPDGLVIVDLNAPVEVPPSALSSLAQSPNFYFLRPNGKWENGAATP